MAASDIVGRMARLSPTRAYTGRYARARRGPLLLLCATGLLAPGLVAQERWVETGGDVLGLLIPAAAYATTWIRYDDAGRDQFYLSFATNFGATMALKLAIPKDRPDGSSRNAFPSGHTSMAFQGATFIHLRYGLRYSLPAYAGAAFVGYSREYAGKHEWIDVFSGATLGTLSSLLFTDRFENVQISAARAGGRYGLEVRARF